MSFFRQLNTNHVVKENIDNLFILFVLLIQKMQSQQESRLASSSFIMSFFQDMEALKNAFANYCNALAEARFKYGDDFSKKATEEEKKNLISFINFLRFYVIRTYLNYNSLEEELKEFKKDLPKITELYEHISVDGIPKITQCTEYVLLLNKTFVKGVIADLLVKAQDVYAGYVGQQEQLGQFQEEPYQQSEV